MFWLGVLAAIAASALFNIGIALQALEARRTALEQGLRISLVTGLIRRPRWMLGLLLGGLGVPLELVAFANAPFVVVEPLLSVGLLVLLALGVRMLDEPLSGAVIAGVIAIIVGTFLVAWG